MENDYFKYFEEHFPIINGIYSDLTSREDALEKSPLLTWENDKAVELSDKIQAESNPMERESLVSLCGAIHEQAGFIFGFLAAMKLRDESAQQ